MSLKELGLSLAKLPQVMLSHQAPRHTFCFGTVLSHSDHLDVIWKGSFWFGDPFVWSQLKRTRFCDSVSFGKLQKKCRLVLGSCHLVLLPFSQSFALRAFGSSWVPVLRGTGNAVSSAVLMCLVLLPVAVRKIWIPVFVFDSVLFGAIWVYLTGKFGFVSFSELFEPFGDVR